MFIKLDFLKINQECFNLVWYIETIHKMKIENTKELFYDKYCIANNHNYDLCIVINDDVVTYVVN